MHDGAKAAEAVNLVYVNDKQMGINRSRKGTGFVYTCAGKQIKDKEVLLRIKGLVIPPAWEQVWISNLPNGHIQATGLDINGRKQYRYHPLWSALRSETKFFHLHDFGKMLPGIRKCIKAHLSLPGLPLQKVLATIVSLMEHTGVRIGNDVYEKLYGSYGLTTLKDQHIKINGNEMKFSFTGKKGVSQNFTLKNKKLARIVQQCRDIPGRELFQYYDEDGMKKAIDSGMVNNYIKTCCGQNFTAKDFRTWVGTLCAFETFIQFGCCEDVTETKKKIIETLDIVAKRLGNTRTVCKKYYIHPVIIDHYSNNTLNKYIKQLEHLSANDELSAEEQVLMKIVADAAIINIETALAPQKK